MRRALLISALLMLALGLTAGVRVIEQTGNSLTVEFLIDDYELIESEDYTRVILTGAGYPEQSGAPSLPSYEFKIGVPPDGDATFSVITSSTKDISLNKRIEPVPYVENEDGMSAYRYEADESLYNTSAGQLLSSRGKHIFRSHPFIPIVIHPFSYDGMNQIRLTTSALIKITLKGNTQQKSPPTADPLAQMVLDQMLNGDDARYWQEQQRAVVNHADFSLSPWWLKVETDKPGMYRINQSHLNGFPLAEIDPRSIRMFSTTGATVNFSPNPGHEFKEIPIHVVGEADGNFDSGDYVVFYGADRTGWENNDGLQIQSEHPLQPNTMYHNPYSHNRVYWLTFAGDFPGNPLRMNTETATQNWSKEYNYHREVVHVEEETHRRVPVGLQWFMTLMAGRTTTDYTMEVNLPDLLPSPENTLAIRMQQESLGSGLMHTMNILVNDVPQHAPDHSHDFTWYSTSVYEATIDSTAFTAGTNRITFRIVRNNTQDNLLLDYYRITYNRKLVKTNAQFRVNSFSSQGQKFIFSGASDNMSIYAVRDDYNVSMMPYDITNGGFSFVVADAEAQSFYVSRAGELYAPVSAQRVTPAVLTNPTTPIQTVIVTPEAFQPQAEQLAQMYEQNWSLSTKVVLQEDIFNHFTGGHPDPAAIRQYVRYLYYNAPAPKIQSLVLLGLGTLDWRNYSGVAAPKNQIMVYQTPLTPTPNVSDDYFAMINTINYPEIMIGRYPVRNTTELTTMLSNFRNYTQNPKPGYWRNSIVTLADDFMNGPNTDEYQHTLDLQTLSNLIHPSISNTKIFAEDYDYDQFLNKPKVRDDVFKQINEGKLLFYYVGHGSIDVLGMQNYMTGATDMGRFQNPDMLPLFITASCEVSWFDHWAYESLGQKSVLLDNRGAIASVGCTRKSFAVPNLALMTYFMPSMLNNRNPLGYAMMDAKMRYTSNPTNNEMYVILGDPHLRITPPARDSSMVFSLAGEATNQAHSRDLALVNGTLSAPGLQGSALVQAYDSHYHDTIRTHSVTRSGNRIFAGEASVVNSDYQAGFFIPDDLIPGSTGVVTAYNWDAATKRDYLSYFSPLSLSDEVLPGAPDNDGAPQISLYLDSYDFREGDTVSSSPTLYARISDANGINLTGSAGHSIIIVLDDSLQPIPVTSYFNYDKDSYTMGSVVYPMEDLSDGPHSVQLIAFDNHNLPSVKTVSFVTNKSSAITLEQLLIYPNPIKTDGYVTFMISEAADITLDVFTMSGRRIRRIEQSVPAGFNKIPYDGRDEMGSKLANNTYFVRLKARNQNGKTVEKQERLVIYK
ncbi:MAG: type IX secretion system sortase PorU [Candidatus Cloacimonetes bacterium]|nr:type IX secretion system sortase PorU [Candidatus Cloacimonadota bacterium]